MDSADAFVEKSCKKCLTQVKVYLTCFECDAIYHIYCLKKVPGVYVNQQGHLFCCRNINSKLARNKKNSRTQHKPSEKLIDKGSFNDCNKDLKNYLPGEKDSESNKFKCDACYSEFGAKDVLVKHCLKCPKKLRVKESIHESNGDEDLKNYLPEEKDSELNKFKCDACYSEFEAKDVLVNHCLKCPKKLRVKESIHESNGDEAGLVCSFCKEEKFQKESYEQHIKRCEKYSQLNTVISKKTPEAHILAKHPNLEKNYKCSRCKYSCCMKAILVNHMRTHTNERLFECDMCNYTANQKSTLTYHILAKHSNSEKRYKCNYCKHATHKRGNLVSHMRIHTNERPFKCDSCNYAATSSSHLNSHILAKHSNAEKRYKCNDCKYSTNEKRHLVRHTYIHTDERPFKCDICDYTTIWKNALKYHILTKHSNSEKMYKCNNCKYSAHEKGKLVPHMRIHTNERPFKCESCNYAAGHSSTLKAHILAKHSNAEKSYKCNDCKYSVFKKQNLVKHIHNTHQQKQNILIKRKHCAKMAVNLLLQKHV